MEIAPVGHHVHFTMNGTGYSVPSRYHLTGEEFCPMLYYTRRLLGYVVYPRWFITRMFLSEVIGILKKNNMYKFGLKKIANNMVKEFDMLENLHLRDFEREFVEVMAASLSNHGMEKLNELRGSVGGSLSTYLYYGANERSNWASNTSTVKNQPSLACANKNDAFTVCGKESLWQKWKKWMISNWNLSREA